MPGKFRPAGVLNGICCGYWLDGGAGPINAPGPGLYCPGGKAGELVLLKGFVFEPATDNTWLRKQ